MVSYFQNTNIIPHTSYSVLYSNLITDPCLCFWLSIYDEFENCGYETTETTITYNIISFKLYQTVYYMCIVSEDSNTLQFKKIFNN